LHELSLLENVKDILQNHARAKNFTHVEKITLEIGKLSCVEPEALRFAFDVVMKDSIAANAELILSEQEGLGICLLCKKQTSLAHLYDPCQLCNHPFVTVTQGHEMKIKNLMVI
jgi:hydrogenase nickel incorporation protein HypA/HybF